MPKPYQVKDKFFQKAKEQNYRARSVFKLEEIQERFKLIKTGYLVLDLGAAPGSFMQLIIKLVGKDGFTIGIDLQPIKPFKKPNTKTYIGDIFDDTIYKKVMEENKIKQFDVITSDLAPATTGIKSVDAGKSSELNNQVIAVSERLLKKGGNVILKSFPGVEQNELLKNMKNLFKNIKVFKPKAVRQSSQEVYLIGIGKL